MRTIGGGGNAAQPIGALEDLTSNFKIEVANASDALTDLTAFAVSLEYDQSVEEIVDAATVVFRRLEGVNSLAPLMTATPPVALGRRIVVSLNPGSGTFTEVFRGRITDVDWPDRFGDVTVKCLDQSGVSARAQIRTAREYGSVSGVSLETVMQAVANDNLVTPPTLYFPAPTSAVVQNLAGDPPYGPTDQSVLDALRALAESIGSTIRWRHFGASASDWRLAVFAPSRTKTVADYTFGVSDYWNVTQISQSDADILNMLTVEYRAAGALESITVQDDASIAKYNAGEPLYGTISEGTGSPVNNATLATALGNAALSDLSEPDALVEVTGRYFWPGEVSVDLYTFTANGIHFSSDQTLAAMRFSHRIAIGERPTTKTLCRGKPSGGVLTWRRRVGPAAEADALSFSILRISSTESPDGTTRTFTLLVGSRVDAVHVHYRTVTIDEVENAHDFSVTSVLPVDAGSPLILRPAGRVVTFTLAQPVRDYILAGRSVPYGGTVEGGSVPFTVDAAPPAINATIHATKAGALASLSIDIAFGVSDAPVTVAVIERLLGVPTTLLTLPMSAPATIDWTTHPELADRPIPADADSLSWTATITDVAGQAWLFGPTVALPSVVMIHAVPSESAGPPRIGTVTVTITDAGDYLDPTHVDGAVTSQMSWHVTRLGVTSVVASTTEPAGTSGTYTREEELDPIHPIVVAGFLHYVDGSTESFGSWTFDSDKIADVVNATVANTPATATVTAVWDTDALVGVNCARYSVDGGAFVSTVAISAGYLSQFNVTRTAARQVIVIQAKNAVDAGATYGNATTVEIDALESGTIYTEARTIVTAVSATQITVTVSGNALSGTPTVGLVAVTGSATIAAGHAAGTYTYAVNGTDNVWVFNRGAFGGGPGQVQFRAITTGAQSDDDFVEIPEQGRDTVYLVMRARITASTATTATVRVAVADPYPQGANSVTIAYTETGGTGTACSPASGGTVTPASTLTEAAGTYIDYTVTRPAFTTGTRRVTFTATAAGRVSDSDAVDIPAVEQEGTAQGTISFNPISGNTSSQASMSATADGPPNALSFYYKHATGASAPTMPSDASTVSTGTLESGSRLFDVVSIATVNLGTFVALTIVPFSGTSGSGTQLPSIHLRGAYTSFGTSKTSTYPPSLWQEESRATTTVLYTQYDVDGNVQADVTSVVQVWTMAVLIPNGVTITQAAFNLEYTAPVATSVTCYVDRKSSVTASTNIGSAAVTNNASPQTVTIGLSESTTARAYQARINVDNLSGNNVYIGSVSFTYTAADQSKTI